MDDLNLDKLLRLEELRLKLKISELNSKEQSELNRLNRLENLKLLNDSYRVITNQSAFKHHNGKRISLEEIKKFYEGFYYAYGYLIKDKKLPKLIKMDIIAKKEIIDKNFYPKNITYQNYNYVKLSKSLANKIPKNINSNNNNLSANLTKLRIKPNK